VDCLQLLDALKQFSKTAYFHLSKKHRKLKEYSAFINARIFLYDIVKGNHYFQKLFLHLLLAFNRVNYLYFFSPALAGLILYFYIYLYIMLP
jgi:hypothetical protein